MVSSSLSSWLCSSSSLPTESGVVVRVPLQLCLLLISLSLLARFALGPPYSCKLAFLFGILKLVAVFALAVSLLTQ